MCRFGSPDLVTSLSGIAATPTFAFEFTNTNFLGLQGQFTTAGMSFSSIDVVLKLIMRRWCPWTSLLVSHSKCPYSIHRLSTGANEDLQLPLRIFHLYQHCLPYRYRRAVDPRRLYLTVPRRRVTSNYLTDLPCRSGQNHYSTGYPDHHFDSHCHGDCIYRCYRH